MLVSEVTAVNQSQIEQRTGVGFRHRITEIAKQRSAPLLDLTPAFERHLATISAEELSLPGDDHSSPKAHALVAREVKRYATASVDDIDANVLDCKHQPLTFGNVKRPIPFDR